MKCLPFKLNPDERVLYLFKVQFLFNYDILIAKCKKLYLLNKLFPLQGEIVDWMWYCNELENWLILERNINVLKINNKFHLDVL